MNALVNSYVLFYLVDLSKTNEILNRTIHSHVCVSMCNFIYLVSFIQIHFGRKLLNQKKFHYLFLPPSPIFLHHFHLAHICLKNEYASMKKKMKSICQRVHHASQLQSLLQCSELMCNNGKVVLLFLARKLKRIFQRYLLQLQLFSHFSVFFSASAFQLFISI